MQTLESVVTLPKPFSGKAKVAKLPSWKNIVTVSEAATASGYNAEYIRRLIRQEKVEAVRIGNTFLVNLDSLLVYRDQNLSEDDARYGPKREGEK